MSAYRDLARTLQAKEDAGLEELSTHLTALVISSVHDQEPALTLDGIYKSISSHGVGALLDPLGVLPCILPSTSQSASDLVVFMGQHSNAKETMIAIQEAVERIEHDLNEEEDGDESDRESDAAESLPVLSRPAQLIRLIDLYGGVIPRLELRRRRPSETLRSAFTHLKNAVSSASDHADVAEGREMIRAVSILVTQVAPWIRIKSGDDKEEHRACEEILVALLTSTLELYQENIESSLAQRTFQKYFPRLVFRSATKSDWQIGEKVVQNAKDAAIAVGVSEEVYSSQPSVLSLVLLAHSLPVVRGPLLVLSSFLQIILYSIQRNTLVDEALTVLLYCLHDARTSQPSLILDPESAIPLCAILPILASSHPDPPTRHLVYRLLSTTLALSPPLLRLQLLKDLLTDTETISPQMRVAAIGLVKEAVLEALSEPESDNSSIFASPALFGALGSVLLRPDPPDLLSPTLTLSEFLDTSEPSRMSEILAFFYVVFIRDVHNKTRIRSIYQVTIIRRTLLQPLRLLLNNWLEDPSGVEDDHTASMVLASLQTNLERVENAVGSTYLDPS